MHKRSKMSKNSYDYPVYLFNEGTNYESYKFFCPCGVQKDGKKYYRFRVWAPNAKSVSVVGDFNGWNKAANVMKRISDGGVYELFIEGLKEYDKYKYAVTHAGETVFKADPYAFHAETHKLTNSKVYDLTDPFTTPTTVPLWFFLKAYK